MRIVWNSKRTFGIVVNFPNVDDENQLCYELRKGSSNTLGFIDHQFQESWSDFTSEESCEIDRPYIVVQKNTQGDIISVNEYSEYEYALLKKLKCISEYTVGEVYHNGELYKGAE